MKRKIAIIGVLLCLALSVLAPILVHAQSTITVQSSSAQVDFPSKLTFNLSAKDSVNLTDIRLRYITNRESFAKAFNEAYITFTPSASVNVNWVLDMQKTGGLPPGTMLKYWWVIKDAGNNQLETEPQQIEFNDNRYQWQNVSQGNITLYWYRGNNAFANQLMEAAQQALASLEKNTGAQLVRPIRIYIYNGPRDLQGSMIFPAEWTRGVTFS